MARGRMLSADASIDPELNSLTIEAMTLYLLAIAHLDRDGLIDANPVRLSAQVAPLRAELRDRAGALINEWIEAGLVTRYSAGRNQYALHFKGFRKHNRFEYTKDRPSELPPPPGWFRTKYGMVPEDKEACFRLAAPMHPESKYRQVLLEHAGFENTSRSGLEGSRDNLEDFSPRSDQIRSDKLFGVGDVQSDTIPSPGRSSKNNTNSTITEGAPTRLTQRLGEFSDDELRIAADAAAQMHGLPNEYTGWARMISGSTREELMLILAWCRVWDSYTVEQYERINNFPAMLRHNVKERFWPGMPRTLIDDLANAVEDAVFAAVPEAER